MSAIKKSVSMPDDLWSRLEKRAEHLGYSTISAYLQHLVREDVLRQGAHVRGIESGELKETAHVDPKALALETAHEVADEILYGDGNLAGQGNSRRARKKKAESS